ncbi:hypothetical protein L208DRAFT_1391372 [Tricholoma matsutake]|nr:hypothetical protein L208DRAFT_1391372 [Tricholoma matsutake 945]
MDRGFYLCCFLLNSHIHIQTAQLFLSGFALELCSYTQLSFIPQMTTKTEPTVTGNKCLKSMTMIHELDSRNDWDNVRHETEMGMKRME